MSELDLRSVLALAPELLKRRSDFRPLRPGVEIARLYEDAELGGSAGILRYAPGSNVPRHRHTGFEHVLVLEGEQSDERGSYAAGTLVVNPPGSEHSVRSTNGCLVLLIWQRPVVFLDVD